jgi:hypothetical protein
MKDRKLAQLPRMVRVSRFKWTIHQSLSILLKVTLVTGAALAMYQGRYQAAVETFAIFTITFLPLVLGRRFQVRIPHEFELFAVLFVYASLFLGEVHGYYTRYWWWDILLHTGSSFLLGIFGFLLVYVLNEKKEIDLELSAGFIALFAFAFAMALGVIWELFEFGMDRLFGLNMQKTMFDDLSGLTDTMWDLIVDGIGAGVIALLGYKFLRVSGSESFLEKWIDGFIDRNPRLFKDG